MKRFERFGEYLYDLLPAVLRKGIRTTNQLYLFFHVVGTVFDDIKQDIFRVRRESMVATASEAMLPEHGRERDMPRLDGETGESYRSRLAMKGDLAAKAGTTEGIRLVLISFGADGEIIPYYTIDPARWAEFLVRIWYDLDGIYVGLASIRKEIRKAKQASAKDNYEIVMASNVAVEIQVQAVLRLFLEYYPRQNLEPLMLDALWILDGDRKLNGYKSGTQVDFYPVIVRIQLEAAQHVKFDPGRMKLLTEVHMPVEHVAVMHCISAAEEDIRCDAEVSMQTGASVSLGVGSSIYIISRLLGTRKLDGTWNLNGGRQEL